ncbi:MAG TPA: aldehyde dehydrogenase family protein, partial [Ohtaekwangia sp.]
MFKSIHPFDQSLVEEFQELSASELKFKIDSAARAFLHWKKTSFVQRCDLMMKVAGVLRLNKEKYAQAITREMGKIISEARTEVDKCAAGCEFFARQAENFLADEIIQTESKKSLIAYQPIGAVLAIMPWNFPFWQVFRFAAPALMAGNVGLLKHAPNVTRCALMIEEIFRDAGFPEGVFQSLLIDVDKVENVIASPIVQGIALTGSERAGAEVGAIGGRNIKKTVLELGG